MFAETTPSVSIAAHGDSVTHGYADQVPYPTQLVSLFSVARTVYNGGISSETSTNVLSALPAWLKVLVPISIS
ncbi:MAG TPA: hypothetical protein VM103_02040 [Candidatus Paceibacterota bacterium]|nr:hypothetical protein [Candidatus Paceibacterota bacterium]